MVAAKSYSCEKRCVCEGPCGDGMQLIVVTGGPGAGKTAILEFLRKDLCEHIAILPEAASILFGGGFYRLDSDVAKMAAQRTIYHIQNEMQNVMINENKWAIGLCDRGTLDGLAYWPGTREAYFESLHTTLESEFAKYLAVIHLATPTAENGYNYDNPIRIETPAEAAAIDERIHLAWKGHPKYYRIESTSDFLHKVSQTTELVHKYLPTCCLHSAQEEKS